MVAQTRLPHGFVLGLDLIKNIGKLTDIHFKLRVLVITSRDDNGDNWILEWLPDEKERKEVDTLIVANHDMLHFFPASVNNLFVAHSSGTPSAASSSAASFIAPQEEKQILNFKERNAIIENALLQSGLFNNADDSIGLLNQTQQCLQQGVMSNEQDGEIRFVPMLTITGHYTVQGKLKEVLTCNCRSGISKSGKTMTNLCAHKLATYLDAFASNEELSSNLQACLVKYKQAIKLSSVSVARVAAGCGQKKLGGAEHAVGKKSQQPTKAANAKSGEKRGKMVKCVCSAKIQPGWGRCSQCNTPRPQEQTCPQCQTSFGFQKLKFCPIADCNYKFEINAEESGVTAAEALLALVNVQPEVVASIGNSSSADNNGHINIRDLDTATYDLKYFIIFN